MRFRTFGVALLLVVLAGAGFLGFLGWFGGRLFIPLAPAAAAAPPAGGTAAIVLSGDMGFHLGMAPRIARRLTDDGMPVIGVSSVVYFRHRRDPEQIERLVAEAMRRALSIPNVNRVVLIGDSFGADMLPIALARLPAGLRSRIELVGLVVPGETVYYRVSPGEVLNLSSPDAKAMPTAAKLDWIPVVCISGRKETDSLCPHMKMPNVRRVVLPGGHYLDFDADAVHRVLLNAIESVGRAH
jgi:type IV secretory pathway VirJ component